MKQIAFLIPTIDQIGGAERQLLQVAKELSTRNWRVTVIALSGSGGAAAAELIDASIGYLSLGMRKAWIDPRGWLRYQRWAAVDRPEIVHAHLPHATWFARWVRLLTPVCIVVDTIHTSKTGGWSRRLGYRISGWLSNHVTCVSQSVAAAVEGAGMAPGAKLTIVHNGVTLPVRLSKHAGLEGGFLWIAVGRLSPVKNYPCLLRAFAALSDKPRLVIAGSGPDELLLRRLAIELRVEERVHFAGFQVQIEPLLAAADGFVLASLWEGLPASVLEAQAACLPVVVSDAAGTAEAMIPDVTGLLVPVDDCGALTVTMSRMMAMPAEARRQMGARGRDFVESNFSLARVTDRWELLYAELLQAHPRPRRRAVLRSGSGA